MPDIPSDPFILLSWVNTKLRDEFSTLSDLCTSLNIDETELRSKLSEAGFDYNPVSNQFR